MTVSLLLLTMYYTAVGELTWQMSNIKIRQTAFKIPHS